MLDTFLICHLLHDALLVLDSKLYYVCIPLRSAMQDAGHNFDGFPLCDCKWNKQGHLKDFALAASKASSSTGGNGAGEVVVDPAGVPPGHGSFLGLGSDIYPLGSTEGELG